MSKVLNKLANNKHGRDLLTGQWVKILKPLHGQLKNILINTIDGKEQLPD